jgi:hypothetical protein
MLLSVVGRILTGQFSPRRNAIVNYDPQASADELARWDTALPHELRCMPVNETLDAPFWAAMLQAYYKSVLLYLFGMKHSDKIPATAKSFYFAPHLSSRIPRGN